MAKEASVNQSPEKGFDQLAVGLKSALQDFEQTQSPESMGRVLTSFQPIFDYATRLVQTATSYVQRRPIQSAALVAGVGLVIALIARSSSRQRIASDM